MSLPTFDESWHRVAPRRIRLRPGVEIFPQSFRGERWYVVRDGLSGKFFRIRTPAYQFLCELERSATVEEAWHSSLAGDAEHAPGQGEIILLLSQLHRAGLIRSDVEGAVEPVLEALEKERHQAAVQRWSSVLFFKLPLWNPDGFLRRTLPAFRWLISPLGAVLWLALLLCGVREVLVNWTAFQQESEGFLGLANLPWMYVTMVVIKVLHEMGHGYFCRRFGGEVPEMGVMLLLFNPLPYVDASSSTAFRSKWQRIAVGAAGMIVEIAVAAVAAIIWAHTSSGTVHVVAYNAILVASLITVLFNANPLLRYDGYHMLSDWLEVPNLQQHASAQALHLLKRYALGLTQSHSPAATQKEAWWLSIYFISAILYRTVMMVGILFYISQSYLVLGVVLAVVFGFLWIVMPVVKAIRYLWTAPELDACRLKACGIALAVVVAVLAFLTLVPMPNHFRADAVVHAEPFSRVYSGTDGVLSQVLIPSGTEVQQGVALVQLEHPELDHRLTLLNAEQTKAEAQARLALNEDPARYAARHTYFRALAVQRENLLAQRAALVVRAPSAGRWVAPEVHMRLGQAVQRGMELGVVQGEQKFFLSAVVKQADVSRLFTAEQVKDTRVKVRGQEGHTLSVHDFTAIPAERENLPSAALGILGGGTTMVDSRPTQNRQLPGSGIVESEQGKGTRTTEPVFEIRAGLVSQEGVQLVHGERAVARMALAWEPLGIQWARELRQLFQRDYRL
jgi:putative peptide zinc metalloprotease protein